MRRHTFPARARRPTSAGTLPLLVLLGCASCLALEPALFNAALRRPVFLSPADATCGTTRRETYCRSARDYGTIRTCWREECDTSCAFHSSLPHSEQAFRRLEEPRDPSAACARPDDGGAAEFADDDANCVLTVAPGWTAQFVLSQVWSMSMSLRLRIAPVFSRPLTILSLAAKSGSDILRLSVLPDSHIRLTTSGQNFTWHSWRVDRNRSLLLALQIHQDFVSLYVNSTRISPSLYNVSLAAPRNVRRFHLGGSPTIENSSFAGSMWDVKMHTRSLTHREMEELFTGTLPPTRTMSSCRCPSSHPFLKFGDSTYCQQNPQLQSSAGNERYRLAYDAHPVEFINDPKPDTAWTSRNGVDNVVVRVRLPRQLQVTSVELSFYSPLPDVVRFSRRMNEFGALLSWGALALDCPASLRLSAQEHVEPLNVTVCRRMIAAGAGVPYSRGVLRFAVAEQRAGYEDITIGVPLREFMAALEVEISFEGHPFVLDPEHRYHSLFDLRILARCECHSHALECSDGVCHCDRDTLTEGRRCERCVEGGFRSLGQTASTACRRCDCDVHGAENQNCLKVDGQCSCRPFVTGRRCDRCESGYFNHTSGTGCVRCECSTSGSLDSSICDGVTGQCACKPHVEGVHCDRCVAGYFRLRDSDDCQKCDCHQTGSQGHCDSSGQCSCRPGAIGRRCDRCLSGWWNGANDAAACEPCECDPAGSRSSVCRSDGTCECIPGMSGRRCDRCAEGRYAFDRQERVAQGCTRTCDCSPVGTNSSQSNCAPIGGQCPCLPLVTGRRCDHCISNAFGFDDSSLSGCSECNCDARGKSAGVECRSSDGQCICRNNVIGQRCSRCSPGTFGLSHNNVDGCTPCGCFQAGVASDADSCDPETGTCNCRKESGDYKLGKQKCLPYVQSMSPTYGPVSGGTTLTLLGGFLGSTRHVTIAGSTCDVITVNETAVSCITRPLRGVPIESQLLLEIHLDGTSTRPNDVFRYRPDPIIRKIHPLRTFDRGGVVFTVEGSNLASAATSRISVLMEEENRTTNFTSDCAPLNDSTLLCSAPQVVLPDGRRRQQVSFHLGLQLDGLRRYENVSRALPELEPLQVYPDPKVYPSPHNVLTFRPYWPVSEREIRIDGEGLVADDRAWDWNVTVGGTSGVCEIVRVIVGHIICRPPVSPPEPLTDGDRLGGMPVVMASVGRLRFVVGGLRYELNVWDTPRYRYILLGGVAGLLFLLMVLVCCCALCCRKRASPEKHTRLSRLETPSLTKPNNYISAYTSTYGSDTYSQSVQDVLQFLPSALRSSVLANFVDSKRVELGAILAQGQFGRVHSGRLWESNFKSESNVSIKTLREFHVTPKDVNEFLEDSTLLIGQSHDHVLSPVGVSVRDNGVFVILPESEHGDLRSYISSENHMLTVGELIEFGLQVADGMLFLASRDVLHRDLAARNCTVHKGVKVKVADASLSRDFHCDDYFREAEGRRALPVKWMALESLERGHYDGHTDVWSFGVLLWELMTRGCLPYPEVACSAVKHFLRTGSRLQQPDYAPDPVFNLMLSCWREDGELRPNFPEVIKLLSRCLDDRDDHVRIGHAYLDMVV